MKTNEIDFPHYSNDIIDAALVRARIERSKAFYSVFEGLFGKAESGKSKARK